jgi:small subunit ribosomal protein S5
MAGKRQSGYSYEPEDGMIEKVVQIKRVSKKTKGGNQISFTSLVVVGDGKGKVGYSLSRARDVASAIRKGMKKARERMISVPLSNGTILRPIQVKFKGAKVFLKPARKGTGLIAGGPVRVVSSAVGVEDLVAKMIGSKNKEVNVRAIIKAFKILGE